MEKVYNYITWWVNLGALGTQIIRILLALWLGEGEDAYRS